MNIAGELIEILKTVNRIESKLDNEDQQISIQLAMLFDMSSAILDELVLLNQNLTPLPVSATLNFGTPTNK